MGGVSEFFSDQLGVHVKKALRQMTESGLPVAAIPFGYKRQPEKGLGKVMEGCKYGRTKENIDDDAGRSLYRCQED